MHGFALNCDNDLDAFDRDRAVRHRRRRRHVAVRASWAATSPVAEVAAPSSKRRVDPLARDAHASEHGVRRERSTTTEGRKLLRLEARNAETPIERKPAWIKTKAQDRARSTPQLAGAGAARGPAHGLPGGRAAPTSTSAGRTARPPSSSAATSAPGAATSARSTPASPPSSTATSRAGSPSPSRTMGLRYATVTGVARDDLPDGGAWLYAETVRQIHALNPGTGVELLIPDFNGDPDLLGEVFDAAPRGARAQRRDGAAHLQADPPGVPLRALARRAHPGPRRRPGHQVQPDPRHGRGAPTRSSQALRDLHDAGCELITITQYLRPSPAPPPGRALGQARGVRRARRGGRGDRLRRGA